jgi:hypothetical protein
MTAYKPGLSPKRCASQYLKWSREDIVYSALSYFQRELLYSVQDLYRRARARLVRFYFPVTICPPFNTPVTQHFKKPSEPSTAIGLHCHFPPLYKSPNQIPASSSLFMHSHRQLLSNSLTLFANIDLPFYPPGRRDKTRCLDLSYVIAGVCCTARL